MSVLLYEKYLVQQEFHVTLSSIVFVFSGLVLKGCGSSIREPAIEFVRKKILSPLFEDLTGNLSLITLARITE